MEVVVHLGVKVGAQAKLYIPSTLNTDLIFWQLQGIVTEVKCQIMVKMMGYFFHFSSLHPASYIEIVYLLAYLKIILP